MSTCFKNTCNRISNLFQDYIVLFKTCPTNKRYLNLIFKSYWFLYLNTTLNKVYFKIILNKLSIFTVKNRKRNIKIAREDILDICEVEMPCLCEVIYYDRNKTLNKTFAFQTILMR